MPTLTQTNDVGELADIARRIRALSLRMTSRVKPEPAGHPSTAMSAADIIAALHFSRLKWDPQNALWDERDRFILSKGHGVPVLYAAYAIAGAIPEAELDTLRETGSRLQGHPDPTRLPFVEAATGSLGQGLSIAIGLACGAKIDNASWRTYCMLGDGEIEEGQVWEAAMFAPKYDLDNLCAIVDNNRVQQTSSVENILDTLNPIPDKWQAFGWHLIEIDGHDIQAVLDALDEAAKTKGKPTLILAHTVKGKGVPDMENSLSWHGKAPKPEQADEWIKEYLS
jgi:transketolase